VECGNTAAMVNLGNIYEEREDFEKAYYWYREAALADNEQGMFNVANMHFRGWHVAQYYHQKAKDYYEKGIEEGDIYCPVNLGRMYCLGLGGPVDYEKGFDLYYQGYLMGDVLACANLGYCYETGQGRRRSMNHQTARNTGLRFIAGLIAAVMLATTCPAGQPVTDTCSYAYAAESPAKNAAEAPSKITGLKLEVRSRPSATLTWNKSDCDGYKVYRGSKAIARVTAGELDDLVTFTDEELEPGASCTYLVRPYKIVNGDEVYGPYSPALKIVEGYTYTSADTAGTSASAAAIKLTGYTGRDKKLTVSSELDGRKVTEIGEGCFSGNVWVERAYVPEGVVKIGDYAFECCGLLEKVYLPDSLTAIGNGAFSGCGKLMYADISDETASIGFGVFGKNEADFYDKYDSLDEKGQIALPASVTLAEGAFYGAMINGIQLIDVENANYKVVNGSLYSKDGKTLVVYFPTEGKSHLSAAMPIRLTH